MSSVWLRNFGTTRLWLYPANQYFGDDDASFSVLVYETPIQFDELA